jgi:glycogen phosphorylase
VRAIRRFTVRPVLPEKLSALSDLATNLRWSWSPETQDVFAALDPEVWRASGHDPVRTLGALPSSRLEELAKDKAFGKRLAAARADLEDYLTSDRWFQKQVAGKRGRAGSGNRVGAELPRAVAYFSSEYGITSVLPQYSGGLGILAGDHLKTASDLGIPLIGVGLLYQMGYFRQSLSREGWQQESYPVLDPDGLPITTSWSPASSSPRSAACRCCCSTPTSRTTRSTCARSPTASTAAPPSTGCARSCSSASAACVPSARTAA